MTLEEVVNLTPVKEETIAESWQVNSLIEKLNYFNIYLFDNISIYGNEEVFKRFKIREYSEKPYYHSLEVILLNDTPVFITETYKESSIWNCNRYNLIGVIRLLSSLLSEEDFPDTEVFKINCRVNEC